MKSVIGHSSVLFPRKAEAAIKPVSIAINLDICQENVRNQKKHVSQEIKAKEDQAETGVVIIVTGLDTSPEIVLNQENLGIKRLEEKKVTPGVALNAGILDICQEIVKVAAAEITGRVSGGVLILGMEEVIRDMEVTIGMEKTDSRE